MAMEVYDQIEIIPIYQTALILLNITSGSIILNEMEMYHAYQLGELTCCSLICILGVYMMVYRQSSIEDEILNQNQIPLLNSMKYCFMKI